MKIFSPSIIICLMCYTTLHFSRGVAENSTFHHNLMDEDILDIISNHILVSYPSNPFGLSYRLSQSTPTQWPYQLSRALGLRRNFTTNNKRVKSNLTPQINESRRKRGVIHLYNMIQCGTGCNPLIYKGYGCFCGFLGRGKAVDGIDICCQFHDACYYSAKCPSLFEYVVPYFWRCGKHGPICVLDFNMDPISSCRQRLCECDRALTTCLQQFPCPRSRALCRSSPWRLLTQVFRVL